MAQRPNILWISTHDINPDLGCYEGVWPGAEYALTPHLDGLAAAGARYDNAFASGPVCAPSRSAIITGMHPISIGTMHMRSKAVPPPEVRMLPEYFREAGYYCTNNFWTDFQMVTPTPTFDDCGPTAHWRDRPHPEQPFFATFHGMVTHESRLYVDDDAHAELTPDLTEAERRDPAAAPLPPYYPDTEVFRRTWARYAELITQMDHWVGELLAQLEEDGLADNTIVVFWSDHGVGLPRAKRFPYESGLHEPLIVRWPGRIPAGTVREQLVHLLDLAPSMLAACGLDVPAHMQGAAFLDERGCVDPGVDYVFGARDRMDEQEDTSRTVRDARFRYIRHLHPDRPHLQHTAYAEKMPTWRELRDRRWQEAVQLSLGMIPSRFDPVQRRLVSASKPPEALYDITVDPYEIHDLAGDPSYRDDLVRLRTALERWQAQVGDLGLVPEEELLERWRPGGAEQVTAAPVVTVVDGRASASCATPGARIAWTTDPPTDAESSLTELAASSGDPVLDGRRWWFHTGPVPLEPGVRLWFKAWRLGFAPSSEVGVDTGGIAR